MNKEYKLTTDQKIKLTNILKKLPGYNLNLKDRLDKNLFVGDKVKVYYNCFDNTQYITGIIMCDNNNNNELTPNFIIQFDTPLTQNNCTIEKIYFNDKQTSKLIVPYVNLERIEKINSNNNFTINIKKFMTLLNQENYEKLYNELLQLDIDKVLNLSNEEKQFLHDFCKIKKGIKIDRDAIIHIRTESSYQFLSTVLPDLIKIIEDYINHEAAQSINSHCFSNNYTINDFQIYWSYVILRNHPDILTIDIYPNED